MRPLIIAHRGASGYLPEHTLEAKRLAFDMGADYLEQDVVASADDELIVLHDIHLDRVTDVAERFPGRQRDDGRYYARDFDLGELRSLRAWERLGADGEPVFPGRFPARNGRFRLHTLAEELDLIAGLNARGDHVAGVYPEIKRPAWHREQGVDITPMVLECLADKGYSRRDDRAFLQCFDAAELHRIRHELRSDLALIQLLGDNAWRESPTDFDALCTASGIAGLAGTADGIGPWLPLAYTSAGIGLPPESTGLVEQAHAAGLAVHPFTFRLDELPPGFEGFAQLIDFFAHELAVEALFTDFPDKARALSFP